MLEEILGNLSEDMRSVTGDHGATKKSNAYDAHNHLRAATAPKKPEKGHYITKDGKPLHQKPFPSVNHALDAYKKMPADKSKGLRIQQFEAVDTSKLSKKLQQRLADRAAASGKKTDKAPLSASKVKSVDLKRRVDMIAAAAKKRDSIEHERIRDAASDNRHMFGGSEMGSFNMGNPGRISYSGLGESSWAIVTEMEDGTQEIFECDTKEIAEKFMDRLFKKTPSIKKDTYIVPPKAVMRQVKDAPRAGSYETDGRGNYYVSEHIIKVGDKYRLVSHKGKNLGTFDTHAAAAKHEGEVEWFKQHTEEVELVDEMSGAGMKTRELHRHLKKIGWTLKRTSGSHDIFTHPSAKHHLSVPRHSQLKAPLVKDILKASVVSEGNELDEAKGSAADAIRNHPAVEYYGGKEDDHFINLKHGYNWDGQHSFGNPSATVARGELKRIKKCDDDCDSCASNAAHEARHGSKNEETINELGTKTLKKYVNRAVWGKAPKSSKVEKRVAGVDRATKKILSKTGDVHDLYGALVAEEGITEGWGVANQNRIHAQDTAAWAELHAKHANDPVMSKHMKDLEWKVNPAAAERIAQERIAKKAAKKAPVSEAMKLEPEDLKGKTRKKYLGAKRGTTKVGTPAHAIDVSNMKEEEQLDELSKGTLASYATKASSSGDERSNSNLSSKAAHKMALSTGDKNSKEDDGETEDMKSFNRSKGIARAVRRLAK